MWVGGAMQTSPYFGIGVCGGRFVSEISRLGFLLHPGLGNYVPSFAPLSILAPIVAPERFPLRRPVIRESPPQPTKPESRTLDWEGGKGFGRGKGRGKVSRDLCPRTVGEDVPGSRRRSCPGAGFNGLNILLQAIKPKASFIIRNLPFPKVIIGESPACPCGPRWSGRVSEPGTQK